MFFTIEWPCWRITIIRDALPAYSTGDYSDVHDKSMSIYDIKTLAFRTVSSDKE